MTAGSGHPTLTLGSITFELLDESEGIATVRVTMPPVNTFMAAVHKHPAAEEVEVVSGSLLLTHGYHDPLEEVELGPGEKAMAGPDEWHGIANASPSQPLVALLRHNPGHKWAEFVRQGVAAVQQFGKLPEGFVQAQFQHIGVVMKH